MDEGGLNWKKKWNEEYPSSKGIEKVWEFCLPNRSKLTKQAIPEAGSESNVGWICDEWGFELYLKDCQTCWGDRDFKGRAVVKMNGKQPGGMRFYQRHFARLTYNKWGDRLGVPEGIKAQASYENHWGSLIIVEAVPCTFDQFKQEYRRVERSLRLWDKATWLYAGRITRLRRKNYMRRLSGVGIRCRVSAKSPILSSAL